MIRLAILQAREGRTLDKTRIRKGLIPVVCESQANSFSSWLSKHRQGSCVQTLSVHPKEHGPDGRWQSPEIFMPAALVPEPLKQNPRMQVSCSVGPATFQPLCGQPGRERDQAGRYHPNRDSQDISNCLV